MEIKLDPMVITIGSALVAAITSLALYIKSLHKHHTIAQKENLVAMTEAMIKNSSTIQNNTNVMVEMKTLLHSLNERQIKNDARNGND